MSNCDIMNLGLKKVNMPFSSMFDGVKGYDEIMDLSICDSQSIIEQTLKFCLNKDIQDSNQLYSENKYLHEEFLLAVASQERETLEIDSQYVISKLFSISQAKNTEYSTEDLIRHLNDAVSVTYSFYADRHLNLAWQFPENYLDEIELHQFLLRRDYERGGR